MRVLVFGASSAQGYWDSEGGWVDRLKRHYDKAQMEKGFSIELPRVMNLGISGNTAADVLKRIESETQARQNEKGLVIIIQVGSNNAAEQNGKPRSTAEEYQKELEAIINKAKVFTNKIFVVGFPAVDESKTNPIAWADLSYKNENILKFENAARTCAEDQNVVFVPVFEAFRRQMGSGTQMNAHDGLHPNNNGHKLIFELIHPVLDEFLNT